MRAPEFWERGGWPARLLSPLGLAYAAAGRARRLNTTAYRARIPVICVGNVTSGGTGKTPLVQAIAALLPRRGAQPVILLRGHGGHEAGPLIVDPDRHDAAAVGDEALLHAARQTTVVARDRAAGARRAEPLGTVIVMDDGLQNPGLAQDLGLLVIDGEIGLGNGRVIPAGPLREPLADALARTDAVVLVGPDRHDLARHFDRPVLRARIEADPASAARLRGRKVVAFAGIGRPQKFFATLQDLGAELVGAHAFGDHESHPSARLDQLAGEARSKGALLVTTAKDRARIGRNWTGDLDVLDIHARFDDRGTLESLLDRVAPQAVTAR